MTEVVVTLKAPAAAAFGRNLQSVAHAAYLRRLDASQAGVARRIVTTLPGAWVRWRYRLVLDGLAVVLPRRELPALARVGGVAEVWSSVRYHSFRTVGGPQQIGADKLWGSNFATAGQGMRIGIIDDGVDAAHPYFNPNGFQYPPGFPKGQARYATAKVIVQRAFPPPGATNKFADVPFDPTYSDHATHVAGIAAGDYGTSANGTLVSGVAPNAYLGNYKALTTPTPGFGLDGNSPEIAAAIEAAVRDGMNVINLSLGEPEVEPSRDLVVQAIENAAAAGVVPVVAAGNDELAPFNSGTVDSPGTARDAITVAAVDARDTVASWSSAGPTPVSLQLKPDVAAPGVNILSSIPGGWDSWEGTSMATPHVSGAAALLKERHPAWTVAQIKSALVQTADPARSDSGGEAPTTKEGGGVVDLVKADVPLLFASPTALSFGRLGPGVSAARTVALTDAGGGAGAWSVSTEVQRGDGRVSVPASVTVPGALTVTATGGQATGDETGFVVLSRGTDVRRIPFWFLTSVPKLARERALRLTRPGIYRGTTVGAPSLVSTYRYPAGGEEYPGPERVYRFRVVGRPANVGVAVLSGNVYPLVTFNGSEDHLAGNAGVPYDINPYRASYDETRRIAGVVLPAPGLYDIVFDSRSAGAGTPFTFRYWVNDVTPPTLKLAAAIAGITVAARDSGAGVDPTSIIALVDGRKALATFHDGRIKIAATPGLHRLQLSVSDHQEAKNMEDVPRILPNTATLTVAVRVRRAR
jgi:subtilisin family serine protease